MSDRPLRASTDELKRHPGWIEEYKCGCSYTAKDKHELPGYCPKHGEDRRHIDRYPLVDGEKQGLA